jgi:predicted type IV restriction endonuclease
VRRGVTAGRSKKTAEETRTRNSRGTLVTFFQALSKIDPIFFQGFAALPKHGKRRRYLAPNREELYPGREDLALSHSYELAPGWWIGTNYSAASIRRIITMACDVAGLQLGKDVRLIEEQDTLVARANKARSTAE